MWGRFQHRGEYMAAVPVAADAETRVESDLARLRGMVAQAAEKNPLQAPVAEVVFRDGHYTVGFTVGLAASTRCEALVVLPLADQDLARPIVERFIRQYLSGNAEIGDPFTACGKRFIPVVFLVHAAGEGGPLAAYLDNQELPQLLIELVACDVGVEAQHQRAYLMRNADAEPIEGVRRRTLLHQDSPVEHYAGERRRPEPWYSTLPGFIRVPAHGLDERDMPHWSGLGQLTISVFGRNLMEMDTPYSEGIGGLDSYRERAVIATSRDGNRVFTVRAHYLALELDTSVLDLLEPHDHLWMSTVFDRDDLSLMPKVSAAPFWTEPAHQAGDGLWGANAHLLRITAVDIDPAWESDDLLAHAIAVTQRHVCRTLSGGTLCLTTVEGRDLGGGRQLGETLSHERLAALSTALAALGAERGETPCISFGSGDYQHRIPCRRHSPVWMVRSL